MPINVECSVCRTNFRVRDEFAGKRGKCVKCRAPLDVPAPPVEPPVPAQQESDTYGFAGAPVARAVPVRRVSAETFSDKVVQAVAPTRPQRSAAEILAAFRGEIEPVRPTFLYRLWILVVAGMMVLLPLAYLGLVALVIGAVLLHAVFDVRLFRAIPHLATAAALYIAPLVIGVIVVAFMLKPLFAGAGRRGKTRVLDPSKEPLLFAFVDGVCMSVGAPPPRRIQVDCEANASAGRLSTKLGLFGGELVLTIGLSLVAGLTLKQFAGVLAHEFGHFSQGAGMRLSGLIRQINGWFGRAVHERDEWDDSLVAWSRDGHVYEMVLAGLARVAVWLTRRVLWLLMMTGHAVSAVLCRQMEFDADRYEAGMVGGAVFATTSRRLVELNVAAQGAVSDLAASWQERRLPDNLPKLILANAAQLPDVLREALREAETHGRTRLFDTHPCNRERIARTRDVPDGGFFRLDGPATDLFRDFDALACATTLDFYRSLFGPQIRKDGLYPVAEVIESQAVAHQAGEAFGRFFLEALGPLQPLRLPSEYPAAPADLKAAKQALVAARSDMEASRDDNIAALKRWDDAQGSAAGAEAALILERTDGRPRAAVFGLNGRDPDEAFAEAEAEQQAAASVLEAFESAATRRLELVLSLLESDAVAARVADGPARRAEARALYPCAAHLGLRLLPALPAVMRARQAAGILFQIYGEGDNTKNQPLVNACLRATRDLHGRLQELHWKIGDSVDYPFEHAREDMTLGRFLLPSVPHHNAITDLISAHDEAVEKAIGVYQRVLARLAVTAELVERTVGLKPITLDVDRVTEPGSATRPHRERG